MNMLPPAIAMFSAILKEKGHEVDCVDLYKEKFNPVFSGEKPDAIVIDHQKRIEKSDIIVLIAPIWNFRMPAILEGWIDKVLAPPWAFKFKKLFFWIDSAYAHFGLAKYIHDNFKCELFSIFDVPDEPKKFFQSQKLVKFTKIWFYYDHILKTKRKPDLNYLESIEEKYNIFLWLIAANDRFFNHFNKFYRFSYDEILLILEDEIKLYEMILDEVKPDFVLMLISHQQHNHIFYKICKSRGIKIIIPIPSRFNIVEKKF